MHFSETGDEFGRLALPVEGREHRLGLAEPHEVGVAVDQHHRSGDLVGQRVRYPTGSATQLAGPSRLRFKLAVGHAGGQGAAPWGDQSSAISLTWRVSGIRR